MCVVTQVANAFELATIYFTIQKREREKTQMRVRKAFSASFIPLLWKTTFNVQKGIYKITYSLQQRKTLYE